MRRALLLVALAALVPAVALAAPASVPVTATIQAKPHPQVYCEECIRFSGRVSSPKPVCRSKRTLENALRYRSRAKVYRDPHFTETDGRGRWSIVISSGEPMAWMEVIVPKQRIGGVVCQAARAKIRL